MCLDPSSDKGAAHMRNQKWHNPSGEAFADAGSLLLTSSALAFAAVEGVMRAEEEGRVPAFRDEEVYRMTARERRC